VPRTLSDQPGVECATETETNKWVERGQTVMSPAVRYRKASRFSLNNQERIYLLKRDIESGPA